MIEDSSVLTRAVAAPEFAAAYGDHPDQQADVWPGARGDALPLLVIVHGGFWRPQYGRDQAAPMAVALAAVGWTVAAIGYRRLPGDPDASVDDVRLAIERVPARVPHHDGRVIAIGHSAGGHLAMLAAVRPPAALYGVLALAPAADLQMAHALALGSGAVSAFLGGEPEARPDLDPRRVEAPGVSTRVLHGDVDAVVPLAVSESFHCIHPEVPLERLAGAGHFALIDPLSAAWPKVVDSVAFLSSPTAQRARS